jgi:hypothetical protein
MTQDFEQLVTGNRLRDVVPVYFTVRQGWSPSIDEADLVTPKAGDALLTASQAGPSPLPVVAPYLVEAVRESGHIRPASLRERIRAFGPSV